jgi:hypothetical protein
MAGYDIGVSASTANTTPQGTQAATVFNFNSPGTSFDGGTQSLEGTATAVATTKSPGASNNVENANSRNPQVSGNSFPAFAGNSEMLTYGIFALVIIGAGFFLLRNN